MRYNNKCSKKLKVLFYKTINNKDVIGSYLDSLENEIKFEILAHIMKLKNNSEYRKPPYCKKISKNIFEIRIKFRDCFRVFYAYIHKDHILLLNISKKKSNKAPKKEIDLAIKRLKEYKKKYGIGYKKIKKIYN